MRIPKIAAVILCLLLIGVLPEREEYLSQQPISLLLSKTTSVNARAAASYLVSATENMDSVLSQGPNLLETNCSICHTVRFAMQSGILAPEIDSTVTVMLGRGKLKLDPVQEATIKKYLQTRLPRN
jgi:mono/diheme cytochrome c family protein